MVMVILLAYKRKNMILTINNIHTADIDALPY